MAPFPARRWTFGLDSANRAERQALAISILEPVGQLEPRDEQKAKAEMSEKNKKEFLEKKAWEVALAPGKQFLMTGHLIDQIVTFYCGVCSYFFVQHSCSG